MENKIKVLLIEDDKLISAMYSVKLNQCGYEVTLKGDGNQALEILRTGFTPDVILTDLIMPELDGFAFLEQKKSEQLAMAAPIIALTNLSNHADERRVRELGAADFVVKALTTPQDVADIVSGIVNNKKN